ncbi:MAG: hypothetical protein EBZ48_15875, partial [Proteobacteria bacterium]|nr:hypothetical protein [Pseudomonadota bacterium]
MTDRAINPSNDQRQTDASPPLFPQRSKLLYANADLSLVEALSRENSTSASPKKSSLSDIDYNATVKKAAAALFPGQAVTIP